MAEQQAYVICRVLHREFELATQCFVFVFKQKGALIIVEVAHRCYHNHCCRVVVSMFAMVQIIGFESKHEIIDCLVCERISCANFVFRFPL
jgi:hypothetical protein